ncbi:MAG: hypothetical protein LBK18_05520 [Prevotellaceae bacterium]|nr:hypothetical protein [Prevotellaceae bacterium]
MKKNYLKIAVAATCASVMITACGGTKQIAVSDVTGEQEVKANICRTMQEEKPEIRAYGEGTHFKSMTARNVAEAQARAQFARAIKAAVETATREEGLGMEQYSGNMEQGSSGTDQGAGINDVVTSAANQVIANTVVIKTYEAVLPNKQYKVAVCIEYRAGVSALATAVAKKIEQQISDEDKLKMKFEFNKFRESVEKQLENSR